MRPNISMISRSYQWAAGMERCQRREPGIGFLHRQDNKEEPVHAGHGEYRSDPEQPVPLPLIRREHEAQQGMLLRGQIKADVLEIVALDLERGLVQMFNGPDRFIETPSPSIHSEDLYAGT